MRKDLISIMGLALAGSDTIRVETVEKDKKISSINRSVKKIKSHMAIKRASIKALNIKKHGKRSR